MLHPQAVAAEALWAEGPSVADPAFDVVAERALQRREGLAEVGPDVEVVTDVDADGVGCRLYRPVDGAPVVVQLHGGGFVLGDLETHDAHCRRMSLASGSAVLSVDYRRAPEHRYPAASDDVDTVVDWLGRHGGSLGVDAGRISVTGDSAGGQLAVVAALRRPVFESVAVVYPCLDPSGGYPSYRTETGGLSAEEMTWFWDSYLGDRSVAGAAEQPLEADLASLPPTLVITAEHDPLRDEGEALAVIAAAAGVRCVATRYLGMIHGFYRHPELFDASAAALGQVAAWVGGAART